MFHMKHREKEVHIINMQCFCKRYVVTKSNHETEFIIASDSDTGTQGQDDFYWTVLYKHNPQTYPQLSTIKDLHKKDIKDIIKDRVEDVTKYAHPCDNRDIKICAQYLPKCSLHRGP